MPSKNTKKVIKIKSRENKEFEVVSVPKNYMQCAVCGEWKSTTGLEFRNCKDTGITRTNCRSCYNLGFHEMRALEKETKELLNSPQFRAICVEEYKNEQYRESSVTATELIRQLKALPKGSRVYISYNDSDYGKQLVKPYIAEYGSEFELDGVEYYSL